MRGRPSWPAGACARVSRRLDPSAGDDVRGARRSHRFNHCGANADAETAVAEIIEFDALLAPDIFHCAHRRAARLRVALFELMDCPLGQANANGEFALAPAEHSPCEPDLGRKRISLEPAELAQLAELRRQVNSHERYSFR
jgi:hypothetical protein